MTTYVGIDISARTFDLVWRRDARNAKAQRFDQTPEGHERAIKKLKALAPTRIVLEATGIYHFDLAVALAHAGLPVSVINPRSARHFAQLMLTANKTDALDAALLAEYAERMTPPLWSVPDAQHLALRDIGRQINRLTGARTQAKNRLHALGAMRERARLLIEDEQLGIEMLDARIARLQQAAQALVADSPVLRAQLEHFTRATGVGAASALAILAELCVMPSNLSATQLSRYAGLDVRLTESGTSVKRPGRLSKAGNAYLRAALFMPAMCAVRHDPHARAFFQALVARGKKRIQAVCAVMRKYLTGLWHCFINHCPFDSTQLFSDKHLQKT